MKRDEFIQVIENKGFGFWTSKGEEKIYGKVTYTDAHGNLCDWEEWRIFRDRAVHVYDTNRSVPGWHMCTACGNWYKDEEEEYHRDCRKEVVLFS